MDDAPDLAISLLQVSGDDSTEIGLRQVTHIS